MSFEATLVDALLAKVTTAIPTVTVRNAITSGFLAEHEVGSDLFPFAQAFSVSAEVDAGDFGQELRLYTVNCFLKRASSKAEQSWLDIDAIRLALFADYHLAGTVNRAWLSEYGVHESGDAAREHTLVGIVFQIEVVV